MKMAFSFCLMIYSLVKAKIYLVKNPYNSLCNAVFKKSYNSRKPFTLRKGKLEYFFGFSCEEDDHVIKLNTIIVFFIVFINKCVCANFNTALITIVQIKGLPNSSFTKRKSLRSIPYRTKT